MLPNPYKLKNVYAVQKYDKEMISITPSTPKVRAINHHSKLSPVSGFNCIHSLPFRPFLSTSNPKFGALKSTPKSPFSPHTSRFRFPVIHNRFSTKKWKVSCFRHEESSPSSSDPDSAEEILHESDKSEFSKPKPVAGNWAKSLKEVMMHSSGWWFLKFAPLFVVMIFDNWPWTRDVALSKMIVGTYFQVYRCYERGSGPNAFAHISIIFLIVDGVFRQIGKPWTVPWTAETILQVTLLWVVSFWFVGSWMIPFGAHIIGINRGSLTIRGQASFSLLTDMTEGLAGILILHRCLSRFRPLPPDWFKFTLRGKWIFEVILGSLMFPLVNRLSQFNLDLLPVLPSTPVTLSSVEQSIVASDPVAMALYAVVLVVCAPVWEEIVFRGFLLPSLTRYMPVWCSILVSAVAFALAHFNVHRMIPLICLGVVMGVTYSRSRNLLPSMLLHSLWNGFVFLDLMKLN